MENITITLPSPIFCTSNVDNTKNNPYNVHQFSEHSTPNNCFLNKNGNPYKSMPKDMRTKLGNISGNNPAVPNITSNTSYNNNLSYNNTANVKKINYNMNISDYLHSKPELIDGFKMKKTNKSTP